MLSRRMYCLKVVLYGHTKPLGLMFGFFFSFNLPFQIHTIFFLTLLPYQLYTCKMRVCLFVLLLLFFAFCFVLFFVCLLVYFFCFWLFIWYADSKEIQEENKQKNEATAKNYVYNHQEVKMPG